MPRDDRDQWREDNELDKLRRDGGALPRRIRDWSRIVPHYSRRDLNPYWLGDESSRDDIIVQLAEE
jgi:hypothetical protein